ncbi:butyrate kinase [Virgibacillus ihumii]|uniref:butyrate kinase n=1 Tax=Virgibacillus ihumii TaxID=2686091 RepID=UPI00157C086A|nr:butyrate kinase [Virgibacillus ihumii]
MAFQHYRIMVVNPGPDITKIGIFEDEICIMEKIIQHDSRELEACHRIADQAEIRKSAVLEQLDKEGMNISRLDAVCGRGGLLRPIKGGTYRVSQPMLYDLKESFYGEHVSNLGGIIAYEIADGLNIPSFIVDPIVVDELDEIARISGVPEFPRKSIFHALNHKAVARQAAAEIGKAYTESNLIVAHMSDGITIGAHHRGNVIDVNNGLHGEGPFSTERAGTVPSGSLAALCYSSQYYLDEIMQKLKDQSGLKGYLHTSDPVEIEKRVNEGDRFAKMIYEAMVYQITKEIGAMSTVLKGDIDAVVLTGTLAHGKLLVEWIANRVNWIADVITYPGENDLQALNNGTLRVLKGEELPNSYPNYSEVDEGV